MSILAAILGAAGSLIGFPYQGTHSAAGGAPDNWQSRNAIDIGVPVGTPVYAPVAGVLGLTGPLGSSDPRFAGLRVNLTGGGQSFYFAHLSRLAGGIAQGASVRQGQLLGYSGSANGVPHLHFAVQSGSPLSWTGGSATNLPNWPAGQPLPVTNLPNTSGGVTATPLDASQGGSSSPAAASGCLTALTLMLGLWGALGASSGFLLERAF